jgi:hypothetical protein
MKMLSPRVILITLVLVLMAGGSVFLMSNQERKKIIPQRIINTEVSFITDLSDPRRLVGAVDNVFIGRIISQEGTYKRDLVLPETMFAVEVIHNIKGKLSGTVIVNQQGGVDEEKNALMLVNDDPLLEPGQMYLFAAKVGGNGDWYTVVPKFGDIAIKNNLAQVHLTNEFEDAFRTEIPYIKGR